MDYPLILVCDHLLSARAKMSQHPITYLFDGWWRINKRRAQARIYRVLLLGLSISGASHYIKQSKAHIHTHKDVHYTVTTGFTTGFSSLGAEEEKLAGRSMRLPEHE